MVVNRITTMGGRAGGGARSGGGGITAGSVKVGDTFKMNGSNRQVTITKIGKTTKTTVDMEFKFDGSFRTHWATFNKNQVLPVS